MARGGWKKHRFMCRMSKDRGGNCELESKAKCKACYRIVRRCKPGFVYATMRSIASDIGKCIAEAIEQIAVKGQSGGL